MGLFAVIDTADRTSNLRVKAAHLSLWVLPARPLGIQHNFIFDVGLRLSSPAAGTSCSSIDVVLPFRVSKSDFADLSHFVLNKEIAPFIFGKQVSVVDNVITYSGASVGEDEISETAVKAEVKSIKEDRIKGGISSRVSLEFEPPLLQKAGYLRVRFRAKEIEGLWLSKGFGDSKFGSIIDLRVCDTREIAERDKWRAMTSLVKAVDNVYFFVICPIYFIPLISSPQEYYCRLIESDAWKEYIGKECYPNGHEKLVIRQWRSEATRPVNVNFPFKVFVDFERSYGSAVLIFYIVALAVAAFAGVGLDRLLFQ